MLCTMVCNNHGHYKSNLFSTDKCLDAPFGNLTYWVHTTHGFCFISLSRTNPQHSHGCHQHQHFRQYLGVIAYAFGIQIHIPSPWAVITANMEKYITTLVSSTELNMQIDANSDFCIRKS